MTTQWTINTQGDPIGTFQQLVMQVWENAGLDAMLVSVNGDAKPRLLKGPQEMTHVNPFKPLMTANAAKLVPGLLNRYPDYRLGLLFRPCELRALAAKARREELPLDRVVTICADCLGTYPAEDYSWRARRIGSSDQLSQETLQFARLGGIAAYRFRSACQVCASPVGEGADLNVGIFGLPVRQHMLVEARDQATAMRLGIDALPVVAADPGISAQRERTVAKLVQRHSQTRERVLRGLGELLPSNIETLIRQLQDCAECRECFNNCPICVGEFPQRGIDGSILRDDILQWMVSCAGCGMCEQACPKHKPLGTIFAYIREQLASIGSELDYAI